MKFITTLLFLLIGSLYCQSQNDSKHFVVHAGKADADGFPVAAARLCFSSGHCFTPPSSKTVKNYPPFGLTPRATIVTGGGNSYVLFTAEAYAGGSGSLTTLALLRDFAGKSGVIENVFPSIELSNQSEFKLLDIPEFDSMPVLITADYLWAQNETHFSHHHYRIKVFMYDYIKSIYVVRVDYVTSNKYAGLDEMDKINVIGPEKPTWTYKTHHWSDKKSTP